MGVGNSGIGGSFVVVMAVGGKLWVVIAAILLTACASPLPVGTPASVLREEGQGEGTPTPTPIPAPVSAGH